MAQDKAQAEAFARALRPYILIEALGVVGGVVAYAATSELLWLIVLALAGGAPLLLFLIRYSAKGAADGKAGKIVE
jgi:hypothetical protein